MDALLTQFMNRYGYTDFHELNADWLIKTLMEMINQVENFVSLNAIKYADPIQWDIVRQYEKNTVVIDPLTGTAYISVQPVPSGVALTRTEYWTVVFDLGSFVVRAAKNFSNRYEADTTLTATFSSSEGDWLVWGDTLYEVIIPTINAGDQYVINSNIKHITMEEVADALAQAIQNVQNDVQTVQNNIGDLDDLPTTDKTSIVNAVIEIFTNLNNIVTKVDNLEIYNIKDFGAVGDGVTNDTQAFTNALAVFDVVYIPNGTYLLDADYTIPSNKTIIGESKEGVIFLVSGTFSIILSDGDVIKNVTFTGNTVTGVVRILNVNNVTLDNILINGTAIDYGLSISGCSKLHINNVEVIGATTDDISNNDIHDSIFTNIDVSNAGRYGFVVGGNSTDIIVSSSNTHNNGNSGFVCVNSSKLLLVGNIYNDNGYHGVQFNGCSYSTYSSSLASDNAYSGYDIYNSYSCKMVGCQSINNGTMGVEVDSMSFNNVVSSSTIRLNGSCGITIYRSPRNTIIGNDIIDNGRLGAIPGFSSTPSGIWIHDDNTGLSRENVIISNQLGDDQGTHTQYYGVDIEIGPVEITISGNNFYSHLMGAVNYSSRTQMRGAENNTGFRLDDLDSYIFIGASNGTLGTPTVPQMLESYLPHRLFYSTCNPTSGLCNPDGNSKKYLDYLTELTQTITDKDSITKIVIMGDTNDWAYSLNDIKTALSDFVTFCKTNFKNAIVYATSSDGAPRIDNATRLIIRSTITNALHYITELGGVYLEGVADVNNNYADLLNDGIHSTQNGLDIYAHSLANAVLGYNAYMPSEFHYPTVVPYDSNISAVSGGTFINTNDGHIFALIAAANVVIDCTLDLAAYVPTKIIQLTNTNGKLYNNLIAQAFTMAIINDGTIHNEPVLLYLNSDGSLSICSYTAYTGVTQITLGAFNIIAPASIV